MLTDKVAVVTGASRGIGRAIALEAAKNHAGVAVIYAGNSDAAEETVSEIRKLGALANAYKCNVGSFDEAKAAIDKAISDFSRIDLLVNNAGITRDSLVLSMKEESFDEVINVNLKGAFNMIRHVYSHMMKRRSGRILNITSVAGIMGNAGQANYSSAKAGMIGLTKTVARELASRNITCNAIAPGFIETDMTAVLSERVVDEAVNSIPLKRMGTPEDIAKIAVFLLSEHAGYITGEIIRVDGGLCM